MSDPSPPSVPEDALEDGGWEFVEESVETLFELAGARIRGGTVEYEDERTRAALREATDGTIDHRIRFFAATRLTFEPSLPPGATPSMVAPTLRREANRSFADRLRERGLDDVEQGRSDRIRVSDRSRARLTKYTATDLLDDVDGPGDSATAELPLECWIAIWTGSSDVTIVTGGYPSVALAPQFALDVEDLFTRSPDSYRDEFISLTRDVE